VTLLEVELGKKVGQHNAISISISFGSLWQALRVISRVMPHVKLILQTYLVSTDRLELGLWSPSVVERVILVIIAFHNRIFRDLVENRTCSRVAYFIVQYV